MATSGGGRADHSGGVTWRALLIAAVLLVLLTPATFYLEIVWYRIENVSSGVPAAAPVVLVFGLAVLSGLPRLRKWWLTRRELLTVYSVLLVGGAVIGHGIVAFALSHNIAYYYTAQTNPLWEILFLEYVPDWFAPSSFQAVEGYFHGNASVPWSEWWIPLIGLWGFMFSLFACGACLMVLLRRQWISHERLSFPLAQIPLNLVRAPGAREHGSAGRLPASYVFWLGVALSLFITFTNSLSERFPALPSIPLGPVPIMRWQKVGPWAGLGEISLVLWPWMIAIAYLVPRELAFSVWFFWLVRLALHVIAVAHGATPRLPSEWYDSSFPAPYFQGGGAAFTLLALVLWTARRHLGKVVRIALTSESRRSDAVEPIPYRWALGGLVLSLAALVHFCWLAGCRPAFGLVFIGLLVGYQGVMVRLRAESGLGFLCYPLEMQELFTRPLGVAFYRRAELVTLVSTHWAFQSGASESYEALPGTVMESFKVADSGKVDARRLMAAIVGAFLLVVVVGTLTCLTLMYRFGFLGVQRGTTYGNFSWQTLNDGGRIASWLTDPGMTQVDHGAIFALLAGGTVVLVLGLMRLRFWWWPFHPLGYVAANNWMSHLISVPFFVGWVCKALVIRYGGLRLYRATVPLAIGLIVGDLLNTGIWSVVSLATGGRF